MALLRIVNRRMPKPWVLTGGKIKAANKKGHQDGIVWVTDLLDQWEKQADRLGLNSGLNKPGSNKMQ
jgi:hypothetical protein